MASKNRKPRMSRDQVSAEALRNALAERSVSNYEAIFEGFADKDIAMDEVVPRENVFTYNAWRALGRQVRKGEAGVKVVTWIERKAKAGEVVAEAEEKGAEGKAGGAKFSRTVAVFHISQTDPIQPQQPKAEETQQAAHN